MAQKMENHFYNIRDFNFINGVYRIICSHLYRQIIYNKYTHRI